MASPIKTFKDNIRPADLMLRVYSLLDTNDHLLSDGEMIASLRKLVQTDDSEDLILVYNEIFLGLVRESAQMPRATLRRGTLNHLLRQAVVAVCTGLDSYLPALLRTHLPTIIKAVGRDFIPVTDGEVMGYFADLNFSLEETLRLINDPGAADYISNKILNLTNFKYLSTVSGVMVTGKLLGLSNPWDLIADHLKRDKKELRKIVKETIERRNDIVHRADRSQVDPDGEQQDVSFSWTQQAVDTIEHVCLALDELVNERMKEYQAAILIS